MTDYQLQLGGKEERLIQGERKVTIALIDGQQVEYDAAHDTIDYSLADKMQYLGQGYIYSIGGVLQMLSEEQLAYHSARLHTELKNDLSHFWRWVK